MIEAAWVRFYETGSVLRFTNGYVIKIFSIKRQKGYLFKNGPIQASFSVYFRLFNMSQFKFKFKLIKA